MDALGYFGGGELGESAGEIRSHQAHRQHSPSRRSAATQHRFAVDPAARVWQTQDRLGHKRAQNVGAAVRGPAATPACLDETVHLQQCQRFHQGAMLPRQWPGSWSNTGNRVVCREVTECVQKLK